MAENVGNMACPECGQSATVKADKRKFIYLDCECGIFKYQSKAGQRRVKARWLAEEPEKARQFLGIEEPAPAAPEPDISQSEPEPEPAPVLDDSPSDPPASPPPDSPKKRPFFGSRPLFSANKRKGAA